MWFGGPARPRALLAPRPGVFVALPGVSSVDEVLRRARDFVRDALDAHRQGRKFSDTRMYDGWTVSITVPWVRVVLDGESRGLLIEEAAAIAGVGAPPVRVPRYPPIGRQPVTPLPVEPRLPEAWYPGLER